MYSGEAVTLGKEISRLLEERSYEKAVSLWRRAGLPEHLIRAIVEHQQKHDAEEGPNGDE